MNENQIKAISDYFKQHERKSQKTGVEFEYFIVDKLSLKTISYSEDNGVLTTLSSLLDNGWKGIYEDQRLLGLKRNGSFITLEPGSQIEISLKPHEPLNELEEEYKNIIKEINDVIEPKNQMLIALGYQPQSKIADIPQIPKKRYSYMFEYFKKCGQYAYNMMRGTASLQLSFDFEDEIDYIKKFKVANALSPIFYSIFDNSPIFEGEVYANYNMRSNIWQQCDDKRCGCIDGVFDDDFSYDAYSKYILSRPPIFLEKNNSFIYTDETLFKELFEPTQDTGDLITHALSMVYPDVRTKKYIEIRMIDSLPYPLNFAPIVLWKTIFYNKEVLNQVYKEIKNLTKVKVKETKEAMIDNSINTVYLNNKTIYENMLWLIDITQDKMSEADKSYLSPLIDLMNNRCVPSDITRGNLSQGIRLALEWCIIK